MLCTDLVIMSKYRNADEPVGRRVQCCKQNLYHMWELSGTVDLSGVPGFEDMDFMRQSDQSKHAVEQFPNQLYEPQPNVMAG